MIRPAHSIALVEANKAKQRLNKGQTGKCPEIDIKLT